MVDGCMSVKYEDYKRVREVIGRILDEGMRYDGLRVLRKGGERIVGGVWVGDDGEWWWGKRPGDRGGRDS